MRRGENILELAGVADEYSNQLMHWKYFYNDRLIRPGGDKKAICL